MINDTRRNEAYFEAVKLALPDKKSILEIGTGSGLLSDGGRDDGENDIFL